MGRSITEHSSSEMNTARTQPRRKSSAPKKETTVPQRTQQRGRRHQKKLSIVERLPEDIYAELLKHMDIPQGVLLSLTCKQLWRQLSHKTLYEVQRCTQRSERVAFLQCLERDSPKMIMCTVCSQLHILDKVHTYGHLGPFSWNRECSRAAGNLMLAQDTRSLNPVVVRREALELVLRRAELGPNFGIPANVFNNDLQWNSYDVYRVKCSFNSRAAVVKSRSGVYCLMLKTTHKVEVDLYAEFRDHVNASEAKGCHHEVDSQQRQMVDLLKEVQNQAASKMSEISRDARRRCPKCPCDIYITVSRQAREVYAMLHVEAYRDLGPRGDHASQLWQTHVRPAFFLPDFNREDPNVGSLFGNKWLMEVYKKCQK